MFYDILRVALLALCIVPSQATAAFAQWTALPDGIELLRKQLPGNTYMTFSRVSLERFDVRVATPRVPRFGLGDVSSSLERNPRGLFLEDYLSRYDALASISAGYVVSFSPPTPLGQIKSDGVIVGQPHSSWATEAVFCSDKGKALIESSPSADIPGYRDCLQIGPLLLRDGTAPAGLLNSTGRGADYDRMIKGQVGQAVICIDRGGRIVLGVSAKSVALSVVVTTLQGPELDCANAVRLQPGGMRVNGVLFGVDQYLHPSALLVLRREH
jgi:Phosphodiester glycosidase